MGIKDLTGMQFGRLLVVSHDRSDCTNHTKWLCKCSCGEYKSIREDSLISGHTRSCGCIQKEHMAKLGNSKRTHGMTGTRLYTIWKLMKKRCKSPGDNRKYYFDKGVSVCDEWDKNFCNFERWAIENGYKDDLTLDRIDPDGDYCPENCRWASWIQQQNNRTNNVKYLVDGNLYTLSELCKHDRKVYASAYQKIHKGQDAQEVIKGVI